MENKDSKTFTMIMPVDLFTKLKKMAAEEDRNVSSYIRYILTNHLKKVA